MSKTRIGALILLVAAIVAVVVLVVGPGWSVGKAIGNVVFIVAIGLLAAGLISMVYLVARGAPAKRRAQADLIGEVPTPPELPDAALRGPDTGLYVGSTLAPSWQNRVTVGDLGDRASATISRYEDGIHIGRKGSGDLWIPRESVTAVRTERGLAGKVMTADGLLVIRWVLPNGTELDSGFRADDKNIYPEWISDFENMGEDNR